MTDEMIGVGKRAVVRLLPFVDLSKDEKAFLSAAPGKEVRVAAGQMVTPDQRGESFDLLLEGWAANRVSTVDGVDRINAINLPGDLIGLATFILADPFDATIALTDGLVRRIPGAMLWDIFTAQPRLAATIMLIAQEERAAKLEWNSLSNTTGAYRRLAAFLFRLIERLEVLHGGPKNEYPFPLTQKQVGDVVGVTPVYINQLVGKMTANGIVKLSSKRLTVLDRDALQAIASIPDWVLHRPRWLPAANEVR